MNFARNCSLFVMYVLLTIKYVSTVQYLSISFLYIHNLRLSHFSQLKGYSCAKLSCDSSYFSGIALTLNSIIEPVHEISNNVVCAAMQSLRSACTYAQFDQSLF